MNNSLDNFNRFFKRTFEKKDNINITEYIDNMVNIHINTKNYYIE